MKKQVKPLLASICIISILFTASFSNASKTGSSIYYPDPIVKNLSMDAEFSYMQESLQDLYDDSGLIIVGDVIDEGEIDPQYAYQAVSADVKISEIIKGDKNTGDIITVSEMGERDVEPGIDWSIGGVPLLSKGMKVMLFLTDPQKIGEGENDIAYLVTTTYLGKYFYDNNNNIHSCAEFTDEPFTVSDFKDAMTENQALGKLNSAALTAQNVTEPGTSGADTK